MNLRSVVESRPARVEAVSLPIGTSDSSKARVGESKVYMEGVLQPAGIYDRALLEAGNIVEGPAIITEMDSTTLILSDCRAEVHVTGVILINLKPKEVSK